MHIDGGLIPFFAIGVGLIITMTAILSDTISKTRLKTEQIKADALVRAEEIRARNQLELEKLMQQKDGQTGGTNSSSETVQYNDDYNRQRSRIRE